MRPSPLQLDRYWVDELCFTYDEKYKFDSDNEPVMTPEDLDVQVEPSRHASDPLQWYFKLSVRLDNKLGKFPYRFSVKLTGFFAVHKDCPPKDVETLALVNSPSILYASARELIAITTGRGRMLALVLPAITFYEQPPTKERRPNAPSKEAAPKAASKRGGKKASKKR